jgi:hypothetical protein
MSDYDQQAGEIDDRLNNPEVTPEEAVRPGFWGAFSPGNVIQGPASGALETGSVLAHGIGAFLRRLPAKGSINPLGVGLSDEQMKPWEQTVDETANSVANEARQEAKAVMSDPRVTGSAANIVLGSSKLMTEATLMTALAGGNPIAGAGGVGAIQSVARYQDYRDQGVDDATAKKLALVQGVGAGAGMLVPGGLSASWLANLTPARQIFSELATGAASNVIQGGANRYVTSKILDDAGYHDLAEQSKVLDGEAIFTDLLTGGGFGMLHYLHSRGDIAQAARELARQDSTVADSARAAQDAQQIVERAPGVPVDIQSQAAHRAALEKASEQLLKDEPVDVGDITAPDVQTPAREATFARPAENTRPMSEVLHDEFQKAGVLDEWSKLEDLNDLLEKRYESPSVKPVTHDNLEIPISETEPSVSEEEGYSVGEGELTDEQLKEFQGLRSHVPADEAAGAGSEGESAEPVSGGPADRATGGAEEGRPLLVHRGSRESLSPRDFKPEAFGYATERPSSGLGVFFTNDHEEASLYGAVSSHHLDIRNPLEMKADEVPPFDSVEDAYRWREEQRAKDYDGLVIDASHLGGQTWYVPFEHSQVHQPNTLPADVAIRNAKSAADQVKEEAPEAFAAAAECAGRTR